MLTGEEKVQIALETMAGKGSECGKSFEELAMIIDGVTIMISFRFVLIPVTHMMPVIILSKTLMEC